MANQAQFLQAGETTAHRRGSYALSLRELSLCRRPRKEAREQPDVELIDRERLQQVDVGPQRLPPM
jgi:hypothetical protein